MRKKSKKTTKKFTLKVEKEFLPKILKTKKNNA